MGTPMVAGAHPIPDLLELAGITRDNFGCILAGPVRGDNDGEGLS